MTSVEETASYLQSIAPLELAESWDNVGLLVGRPTSSVHKIMTALTLVPENVAEAIEHKADMVVVHHPLPFHALKRITSEATPGRMLLDLIEAGIAVFSLHTAWDNTAGGINEQLARLIGLTGVSPLIPAKNPELLQRQLGSGRSGTVPQKTNVEAVAQSLQRTLAVGSISVVGERTTPVNKVGIVCGSGGSLLSYAREKKCDLFVTGEATFHQCLEAQSYGIAMLLLGHFASEKFAMNHLGSLLSLRFPNIEVWGSRRESEPSGPLFAPVNALA
jgi:dinuclear metal center YbgI/SA1388 family protein